MKTLKSLAIIIVISTSSTATAYIPIVSEIERGAIKIIHEGGKVVGTVIGGAVQAGAGIVDETGKIISQGGKEISVFGENINNEGNIAIANASREFNKGISDIGQTLEKAVQDTGSTFDKAGKDAEKNIAKSGRDVEEAGHAIGKYVDQTAQSTKNNIERTADRMREGKFVDAIWHSALAPLNDSQKNMAIAATESSLIRTIGQTAASAYGGPQGAAAYAAWLAYHQTGGDINAAIQVGLITGVTAYAFEGMNEHMTTEQYTTYQKALVTASVGAVAIAASGGTSDEIRDGFLSAGAMVLVQDYYKETTSHDLDSDSMKASKDVRPYCTSGYDGACTPVPDDAVLERGKDGLPSKLDRSKIDKRVPSVGVEGKSGFGGEHSKAMDITSKIPGMQGMSVMHDQWVIDHRLNLTKEATIIPAIVIYYTGTGAPYYDIQRKTAIENTINAQMKADAGKSPSAPSAQITAAQIGTLSEPNIIKPNKDAITDSYLCGLKKTSNQMVVEQLEGPPYACRVLYLNGSTKTSKVIWNARHEINYCSKKAEDLSKKLEWLGMTCLHQDGRKKLLNSPNTAGI